MVYTLYASIIIIIIIIIALISVKVCDKSVFLT